MMDGGSGLGPRTRMTRRYGELLEAESFVRRRWEPADEQTRLSLLDFAKALGVAPTGAVGQYKIIRCLSDVCVAVRSSRCGLIAWPTGSDDMKGRPYGVDVAIKLREALANHRLLWVEQASSKSDKLARLYRVDQGICLPCYKFALHRDYEPVEVRSAKRLDPSGKKIGGAVLGRRAFLPEIVAIEEQVHRINVAMAASPLCHPDGGQMSGCRRIFNNGSLKVGGRLYGDWQGFGEDERLRMTINCDPVCEIDIKACFLSIAYAKFGDGRRLADDPYEMIRFVKECNHTGRRRQMRSACKRLVSAYLCKDGELSKFPQGKKPKGGKAVVSFKSEFGLSRSAGFYMAQIKEEFPFLEQQKIHGEDLMNVESNIIVDVLLRLIDLGVVAYPVHDCVIVSQQARSIAVDVLSEVMARHLGYVPSMDISYCDGLGKIRTETLGSVKVNKSVLDDWGCPSDFDLIESR